MNNNRWKKFIQAKYGKQVFLKKNFIHNFRTYSY